MIKVIYYFSALLIVLLASQACERNLTTDEELGIGSKKTFTWGECSDETAWAAGTRFLPKGNWATFTPYQPATWSEYWREWIPQIAIYAGQNIKVGNLAFEDLGDGTVKIHFYLHACTDLLWVDPETKTEIYPEAIKIQGYDTPPVGIQPIPGSFDYKGIGFPLSGNDRYVIVPKANFYGIHLDLWNCCAK